VLSLLVVLTVSCNSARPVEPTVSTARLQASSCTPYTPPRDVSDANALLAGFRDQPLTFENLRPCCSARRPLGRQESRSAGCELRVIEDLAGPSGDVEAAQGFAARRQVGSRVLLRPDAAAVGFEQPRLEPV
jgi:hypothetical protein